MDSLYNEIFCRRSVRKFCGSPGPELLEEFAAFLRSFAPLQRDTQVEMEIADPSTMGAVYGVKAPHYLLLYADGEEGRLEAGYRVQGASLYLSSRGVGSCILGMGKPKREKRSANGKQWAITLAFGLPADSIHREPVEFLRREAAQIGGEKLPAAWREAVRLAPSAVNGQPWYLSGEQSAVGLWKLPQGGVKSLLASGFHTVDMGIAALHLSLAMKQDKKTMDFRRGGTPLPDGPKGGVWIGRAVPVEA